MMTLMLLKEIKLQQCRLKISNLEDRQKVLSTFLRIRKKHQGYVPKNSVRGNGSFGQPDQSTLFPGAAFL